MDYKKVTITQNFSMSEEEINSICITRQILKKFKSELCDVYGPNNGNNYDCMNCHARYLCDSAEQFNFDMTIKELEKILASTSEE